MGFWEVKKDHLEIDCKWSGENANSLQGSKHIFKTENLKAFCHHGYQGKCRE
jgi:hypothetical protein